MSLKDVVERKQRERMTLTRKEKEFLKLQELVKEKGENSISSDRLMDLMEFLDWSDLEDAGISSAKLEEMAAEQGMPTSRARH